MLQCHSPRGISNIDLKLFRKGGGKNNFIWSFKVMCHFVWNVGKSHLPASHHQLMSRCDKVGNLWLKVETVGLCLPYSMASSLACSGDLRLQGMKKEPVKNLRCLSFSDVAFLQCLNTATTLGQDNTSAKIISLIPTNESLLSPPIQFTLLHMLVVLIFSVSIPSIFPVFKTNRQRVPFHTPRVFFPQLHSSMAYWLAEQGHQAPDELR